MININLADDYKDSYVHLKYGDGYSIGVNGIQTALNMLGYGKIDGVNLNSIVYGFYCVNTENMIKQFQEDNNLNITETLTEQTWIAIFNKLLLKLKCVLIKVSDEKINIVDIDAYIDLLYKYKKARISSNSEETLEDTNNNTQSNSSKDFSNLEDYKAYSDSMGKTLDKNKIYNTLNSLNPGMTGTTWYITNSSGGETTNALSGNYIIEGDAKFDDFMYTYIMNGGTYYNGVHYSHNLNGSNSWNEETRTPNYAGTSNKDYDFIYNLLANSVYGDGGYYLGEDGAQSESKSTVDTIKYYGGTFGNSTNKPFFSPDNISKLRQSKFDITIVYGAKGECARKIRQVTPISVSQEMNASGEPIYDIYEFVARDVSYGAESD